MSEFKKNDKVMFKPFIKENIENGSSGFQDTFHKKNIGKIFTVKKRYTNNVINLVEMPLWYEDYTFMGKRFDKVTVILPDNLFTM